MLWKFRLLPDKIGLFFEWFKHEVMNAHNSFSMKVYLFFVAIIFIWGINRPINKIGLQYMPAIWHAAIRLSIGCASMFMLAFLLDS